LVRRIFFALPLVGFAACIDFGDLIGGGDSVSPPADASTQDATADFTDAGIDDGGSFSDAFVPPLVDASFCATADASFCDDFDTVALAVRWESRFTYANCVIQQDPYDAAPSPPNTLLATIPDAGTVNREAFLTKHFVGNFTHFDIGFDILVAAGDTGNFYGAILPLTISAPDNTNYLTYYLYSHGAYAYEQHQYSDGGGSAAQSPNWFDWPHIGKWQHLDIAIDLATDGGKPMLTVTLDGTIVEYFALSSVWHLGPSVALQFGITYPYGTSTEWDLRYDNVTVNAH
jgi:hypothetical protein